LPLSVQTDTFTISINITAETYAMGISVWKRRNSSNVVRSSLPPHLPSVGWLEAEMKLCGRGVLRVLTTDGALLPFRFSHFVAGTIYAAFDLINEYILVQINDHMSDLIRNHVPLAQLADSLRDTSQALRHHLNELPTRRTNSNRIFVERGFALDLLDRRGDFKSLSSTLDYLNSDLR
jgi:hypothetical protein